MENLFSDDENSSVSSNDNDEVNPSWQLTLSATILGDILFTGKSGLRLPLPGYNAPINWFDLLLDVIFLEKVLTETNEYALESFCGPSTTLKSHIIRWKDLTVAKLQTVLAYCCTLVDFVILENPLLYQQSIF